MSARVPFQFPAALRSLWTCGAATLLFVVSPAVADRPASCSNDGQAAPRVLVERFLSGDCADCWTDTPSAPTPRGAVVLDWVLPGERGEDAPLATVARREGLQRLHAQPMVTMQGQFIQMHARTERVGNHRLRVQHGLPVGDHMGASLAFHARPGTPGPFTGWLALAEWLPKGTEGSPVPRVLMRNLLTEPIAAHPEKDWPQLWRPMNIPEGARTERLGVVGWVTDAHGRLVALGKAHCAARP